MTFDNAYASIDNVMKENTNNNSEKANISANNTDANVGEISNDLSTDADVMAVAKQYRREDSQRKVALMVSLMVNIMFLVTAYAILCYDTTGRLFGRILGLNF